MNNQARKTHFFDKVRETMDWEERKAALNQRFLAAFEHAYRNSRAYGEIFQSHGIDLKDILTGGKILMVNSHCRSEFH